MSRPEALRGVGVPPVKAGGRQGGKTLYLGCSPVHAVHARCLEDGPTRPLPGRPGSEDVPI